MLIKIIRPLVIIGNALFICWILVNGINENFEGSLIEKMSYIGLMLLLALNIYFLGKRNG